MSDIKNISPEDKLKLIRMIGTVIVKVDETRSVFDRETTERKQLDILRDRLDAGQRAIIINLIRANTEEFKQHTTSLQKINDELQKTIDDVTKLADTLKNLVKFIEVVGEIANLASRVIGLAAVPEVPLVRSAVTSPFAALAGRTSLRSAEKMSRRLDLSVVERLMEALPPDEDAVDSPPENKPVAPVPVEEVLHGIELTDEKLIITVATGGCTEEDSFHIEVNKGYTGLPPYLVTVYRIKSDDCKGLFEPIRISFSLKELGLEGAVDFRVLNRIGNTSQHRLLP